MAVSTKNIVMQRIKVAMKESPIAVFNERTGYRSVFASTIKSKKEKIKRMTVFDSNFIGNFHKEMPEELVSHVLDNFK